MTLLGVVVFMQSHRHGRGGSLLNNGIAVSVCLKYSLL